MLPSPCLWGAYSHIRKSYFLVKWHHVVLTGQAQPDSGKQGAAGAQPVQGVVTTAASSSLNWRGWGPCRAQLGSCKQHPWDPPVLRHLQREGLQSQQAAPSTLGSLTGLFFFSRVSFYSRSPHTTLEAVPTGTSWVPYPLIKVLTAWRCPLRSFPKAALQEGAGETSVFTAPGQSTTLLPSEGCKQGAQATQAPWKAGVYWDEKCGGPVKERTGGSDLKTLVSRIRAGFVLTEHFTCQWNGDSDWLLGSGEPHQLRSNSHKSIKEIRATPLVSFKSFLIQKKKKKPTNAWLRVSEIVWGYRTSALCVRLWERQLWKKCHQPACVITGNRYSWSAPFRAPGPWDELTTSLHEPPGRARPSGHGCRHAVPGAPQTRCVEKVQKYKDVSGPSVLGRI